MDRPRGRGAVGVADVGRGRTGTDRRARRRRPAGGRSGRPRAWSFAGPDGPTSVAVPGRVVLDQGELLLDAALAGLGVCQVLDFMVDPVAPRGRLVEVLAEHAAAGPPIHAVGTAGKMRGVTVGAVVGVLAAAWT